MRRRRLVRRRFLTGCFIMLLFVTILTGRSMLTTMAEEEPVTVSPYPFSVVVLGNFRRFLLVIFLFLFLHLDFSFIYSKFSMPFWGFFY